MLDPLHLLNQAERLMIALPGMERARMTDRCRAVSTTYYAVFHAGLRAAADQFVGAAERGTALYSLAYRSIDHKRMMSLCGDISSARTPDKYGPYTPDADWDEAIRGYARSFGVLYKERMLADYDPSYVLLPTEVESFIRIARAAVSSLDATGATSRRAFFTLLLFPPR